MATTLAEAPGTIERSVFYRLDEFQNRVKWSRHAMRQARREGLKVRYMHGRAYVSGDDFQGILRGFSGDIREVIKRVSAGFSDCFIATTIADGFQ